MFAGAGNAYQGATNQDLQEAQQNQSFWNDVYSQFNPTAPTINAAPSAPAYSNVANNAKSMFQNSLGANGGPTGSMDQNQVGQNLATRGTSASKTQDINDFLNDTSQNQKSAEQKELSMFGGAQKQNAANTDLFQTAPEKAMLGKADTQNQIANAWTEYQNGQPNFGNELGAGIGGGLGQVVGSKAANSLFGNAGNDDEYTIEQINRDTEGT